MRAALDALAQSECTVRLNLGGVTFMDPSGAHVLVDVGQLVAARGPIIVLRASAAARQVTELCGVAPASLNIGDTDGRAE